MTQNTDSLADIVQHIVDLLKADQDLGLEDVWYGDQTLIPRTPAMAVEGIDKVRDLQGVPFITENTFQVALMLYHARIQDTQVTRKQCDIHAHQVEAALHEDITFDGLVIYGFVRKIESGYAQRETDLMYASRLTWEGLTKTGVTMQ